MQLKKASQVQLFSLAEIEVGDRVVLKSMIDLSKTVAIGRVHTLDPTEKVGGQELGVNWIEVQIYIAVEIEEELMRPYGRFKMVGDVVGTPIAWPRHLVEVED